MPHQFSMPVRWGDMDAYGHVNNTAFFRYFEAARFAYVEAFFPDSVNDMPMVVLADIHCKFEGQIKYPANIIIKSWVTKLGNSSFTIAAEIYHGEKRCAKSEAVMVWCDPQTRRPMRLPTIFVEKVHSSESI